MKKRIRYSELAPPAVTAPESSVPAPAPPRPVVAESPRAIAGRLTPARGSITVTRATPLGSIAISRPTPVRPSVVIPRPTVALPAVDVPAGPPSLRERARARSGTVELLVFALGHEWFGVELSAVEEAIDLPPVRHIPEMPPAMLGVITVRETLTPLFSPASALGLALGGDGSALIFKRGTRRVGIAVDDVDDVRTLDLAQLRDAPGVDARDGVLLGVLRQGETLLALVDADALINACQIVPLMETA